jgi:hypothetical protein
MIVPVGSWKRADGTRAATPWDQQRGPNPVFPITGFRLSRTMLATIDSICVQQDLTRSQVFRRSIMEYLKRHNVAINTDENSPEQNRTWPGDLFDLQR